MKKYSKGKLKLKRNLAILAGFFILLLICGIVLLVCFCFKNTISIEKDSTQNTNISDDMATNSMPIVIDNLVVGALYDNHWISASKYYLKSSKKSELDTYVYTKDIRAGQYVIRDLYTRNDNVFANTSYPNNIDEYFAIPEDKNYALISQFKEVDKIDSDYASVKEALGLYKMYNNTIDIKNVYDGYINVDTPIRIICVTSQNKGLFGGVYSAIIVSYTNQKRSEIVQYFYTKDLENSEDFPLYSVEFLADLNGDGNSELVTRGLTEFNVVYNVFDYKKESYTKVLSEKIKLN